MAPPHIHPLHVFIAKTPRRLEWARWRWCSLLALSGCAAPPLGPKPPAENAMPAQSTGRFVAMEEGIRAAQGSDASGFRLVESNVDGLKWRLVLIDGARHSLDVQYYVWFADGAGQLLMARVIAAADRGVKVRMLFDDLNTMLHTMSSPELRDAMLARVDAHPHIEVRVFNAWRGAAGWAGWARASPISRASTGACTTSS
jgi:putative cardiolipin synthase